MKYYSEITNKIYNSEKELAEAEKLQKEATEKQEALKKERASRAKEVEDAFAKANKLLKAFVKDYGSFHYSYTGKKDGFSLLDSPWFWPF